MGDDDVLAEEKSFGSDIDADELAEPFSDDVDDLKFDDEDEDDAGSDFN